MPTGDFDMLAKSLEKLIKLPDQTLVYSGHTEVTTIADEKIFLNSNFFLTIKDNYSRMATDGGYRALY